ncbi:MAG: hypothetical protein WEA36_06805 [Balneolaceae bacterium]
MTVKRWITPIRNWLQTSAGKRFKKWIRWALIAFILTLILQQLLEIGWQDILRNLPTHPLFYILFFVLNFSLPIAEIFIYRTVWPLRRRDLFKAFLNKRIYNEELAGYSGEFYLFVWARKHLKRPDKEILKNIRDNNILSAINSNGVALALIGLLLFTDIVKLEDVVGKINWIYVTTGILLLAGLIVLAVQFRHYLFSLPRVKALRVFSIYFLRFGLHNVLMVVQWAVVMPDVSIAIWIQFLVLVILINRIPLLPSRDLVFLWAGVELSKSFNMASASVAGMLLVSSALRKILSFALFLWVSSMRARSEEELETHREMERRRSGSPVTETYEESGSGSAGSTRS